MNTMTVFLAALTAATVLTAAPARAKEPLRFVLITVCKDAEFFKTVQKGMQDAAKAMNVQCEFTGTADVDTETAAAMVHKAIADGYNGIGLNITDAQAFDGVIAEAMRKGIPVVAFNVDAQAARAKAAKETGGGHLRMSAICQDFIKAGRSVGQHSLSFIPKGAAVLLTQHDHGITALDERLQGIQEVLKQHGIAWRVICSSNDPHKARQLIAAELKANPDIRFVIGTGQTDTEAAGAVIASEFPKQGYMAAGFDMSPETLRLVKAGVIRFTIDQQPYCQGYYPVVQMALYCRYGIPPVDIDTGASIVTAADVDRIVELSREHYR